MSIMRCRRSCGLATTGSVQDELGWGFEQSDVVEGAPAHGRGGGLDDL